MPSPRRSRPARKRADRYHHGDLRRALLTEAVRVIQAHGPDAVTLRGVGEALGVSRTALYRHFADKSALLAEVTREGFATLRAELTAARDQGEGSAGFEAMGAAYVGFALTNPSHYRVMFGGAAHEHYASGSALEREARGAFEVLVDAIAALQRRGLVVQDDPVQLALYIWSVVHGIAMLAIDGRLGPRQEDAAGLARYAIERIRTGIAAGAPPR